MRACWSARASLASGTPLSNLIPARDVILEIDNKSLTHRPDLWGHYGFARELAAIFGRSLREVIDGGPVPLRCAAAFSALRGRSDGCPCYGCLEFHVAAAAPSPLVIQRRLHALGQRTYNLLVDVTNYAMWELAQPTHAFDGDRVHAIRVARMGRPGTFVTLDGQERTMLADDLLIWDENEPVALAGIMGGLQSEVRDSTTHLLLESANFKASRIRRTSVRLDLRTESAQRFEKSQPPVNVRNGIARILQLIQDSGREPAGRIPLHGRRRSQGPLPAARTFAASPLVHGGPGDPRPGSPYDSPIARLRGRIQDRNRGRPAGRGPGLGHLRLIEAKRTSLFRRISWRKCSGSMGTAESSPACPRCPLSRCTSRRPSAWSTRRGGCWPRGTAFSRCRTTAGSTTIGSASSVSSPPRPLELRNPSAQQNRLLRTTLVPNLLALVRPNRVHRDAFRLFEIGRVYSARGDSGPNGSTCAEAAAVDSTPVERNRLAGVSFNQANQPPLEEQFRAIKGTLRIWRR